MAGYRDKRIYIRWDDAIREIADKNFDGNNLEAYEDLCLAEYDGLIHPKRPSDDEILRQPKHINNVYGGFGELFRRDELEKIYGRLWDEDTKEEKTAAETTPDQLKLALACVRAFEGQQALKKNIIEWISLHWNEYIRSGQQPSNNDLERIATVCRSHKAKKGGYSSKEG